MIPLLRVNGVIDGKNLNFSILSDFDETQSEWCFCRFKQSMNKFLKIFEWSARYEWLTLKIKISKFCPILMKLKTKEVYIILKQNIK